MDITLFLSGSGNPVRQHDIVFYFFWKSKAWIVIFTLKEFYLLQCSPQPDGGACRDMVLHLQKGVHSPAGRRSPARSVFPGVLLRSFPSRAAGPVGWLGTTLQLLPFCCCFKAKKQAETRKNTVASYLFRPVRYRFILSQTAVLSPSQRLNFNTCIFFPCDQVLSP